MCCGRQGPLSLSAVSRGGAPPIGRRSSAHGGGGFDATSAVVAVDEHAAVVPWPVEESGSGTNAWQEFSLAPFPSLLATPLRALAAVTAISVHPCPSERLRPGPAGASRETRE